MVRPAPSCITTSGGTELPALRHVAVPGWWGVLGVAVQQAVARTALGQAWPTPLNHAPSVSKGRPAP